MYPIAINVNAPSKLDTVICVVVPQSTEGEVAPLAPALLSVTDINGMSLKGSSKYIEHLLFMFALTSEDIVNCIMRSLSIFIFLRVAFLQFVTLLVTSLFSTLNKFSTVENFSRFEEHLFNIPKLTFGRVTRIANLATLIIDSGQLFYNKNYEVVLNIPENFRPKSTIFFSASYRNTNKSTTFYISPNGDVTKSGVDDDQGAYYFTITYPIN